MHETPLLINIGVALAAALVGGLLARRARVPPLVGYLVALADAARNLDITWVRVAEGGPLAGRTLAEVELRARTGASVVALYRDGSLVPSPPPDSKLAPGDRLGLIGDPAHVAAAETLVAGTSRT